MQLSFKRLLLLFKKQWVDNQKLYLFGMFAMAGIMAFAILYTGTTGPYGITYGSQEAIFTMGLLGIGVVFSSTLFKSYEEKSKCIQNIMLPASVLEKLLVALFYALILFPIIYTLTTYPLLVIGNYIDNEITGNFNRLWDFKDSYVINLAYFFILIQSFFLLFSIVFKKYALLKSLSLAIILIFLASFSAHQMSQRTFKNIIPEKLPAQVMELLKNRPEHFTLESTWPYQPVRFSLYEKSLQLRFSGALSIIFNILFILVFPFLWLITWFRLREKQL